MVLQLDNFGKKKHSIATCRATGFSLAELMIAVALVTVITAAVGMAVHRAGSRAQRSQATLASMQQNSGILATMVEQLRLAKLITDRSSTNISFQATDITDQSTATYHYNWDSDAKTLNFRKNADGEIILAENVEAFDLDSDIFFENPNFYIRSVTIYMQIGSETPLKYNRAVTLLNIPRRQF